MNNLERATECINDLQSLIRRFNEEACGMDDPSGTPQLSKKVGPNGVPEELISIARDAIQALLDALASEDRSVHNRITGSPPEWWRNLQAVSRDKRAEYAASHPAFLNAMDILDGHVSEDNGVIGGLVVLVEHLDSKIVIARVQAGFRAVGDPNPHEISFAFDPQIHDEIDQPLSELLCEVPFFPKECVAFLREARSAAAEIIKH